MWRAPAALWIPAYAGMTVRLHQGRGGLMVGCVGLFHPHHTPTCGYCLKASMTDRAATLHLWIADQVRNDGFGLDRFECVSGRA